MVGLLGASNGYYVGHKERSYIGIVFSIPYEPPVSFMILFYFPRRFTNHREHSDGVV